MSRSRRSWRRSTSSRPQTLQTRYGLEALAWMVAQDCLDIKVAIPTNAQGEPVVTPGHLPREGRHHHRP